MQDTFLSEAKDLMLSELGFCPEQSRLFVYDTPSLFPTVPLGITALFRPSSLTAHVLVEPESTFPARVIHEYLGHGSFCEQSTIGRNIVAYESELARLESSIVGGNTSTKRIYLL